ncbi:MAG TPA: glycosyl hydrolase [Candidatus Brocadiia bacterium]|nr:glycosyl hydrolase [Candidatus Brocadiia bacterium]
MSRCPSGSPLSDLSRRFASPPAECRPAPFWFWNDVSPGRFSRRIVVDRVRAMARGGLGGFVIFNKPDGGFGPGRFMSAAWFRACRWALEAARAEGMRVWINDDIDYPPGNLGGRMRKLAPEAYHRELVCERREMRGGERLGLTAGDGELVSAVAARRGEGLEGAVDLPAGGAAEWMAPAGRWVAWIVRQRRLKRPEGFLHQFPSFLDPDVSRLFIEHVYEAYERHLGEFFGDPLKGFFSDCDARRLHLFPWARRFAERFEEIKGYDPRPLLPALWEDFGETSRQFRYDYRHVLSLLYSQWFENIHNWLRRRGLLYTYHTSDSGPFVPPGMDAASLRRRMAGEEAGPWPEPPASCARSSYFSEGRYHEVNRHADFVGTDHELLALAGQLHFGMSFRGKEEDWRPKTAVWGLGCTHADYRRVLTPNKTYGDIRARFAGSVARLWGRRGAMCELYAASNWGATLDDFRWIGAWQASQGITFFVPHAFYDSMGLRRKEFAPPNHWGPSHLWGGSDAVEHRAVVPGTRCDPAVGGLRRHVPGASHLWPRYRALTDFLGRLSLMLGDADLVADVAALDPAADVWSGESKRPDVFFSALDILNHSAFDYDVVDEASLSRARVVEGRLMLRRASWRVVVLPHVARLDVATQAKLAAFAEAGGRVISMGPAPAGLRGVAVCVAAPGYDPDRLPGRQALARRIEEVVTPDALAFDDKGRPVQFVRFRHVRKEGMDVYLLTNLEGEGQRPAARFSLRVGRGTPRVWDPATCERREVAFERVDGRTEVSLRLEARDTVFVVFEPGQRAASAAAPMRYEPLVEIKDWRVTRLGPNMAPLTLWRAGRGKPFPWARPQSEPRRVECVFEAAAGVEKAELMLPAQAVAWRCRLNGKALEGLPWREEEMFDDAYRVYDLRGALRRGGNRLEMDVADLSAWRTLDFTMPYLRGDFGVEVLASKDAVLIPHRRWYHFASDIPADARVRLRPERELGLGSWARQGCPFYSGAMRYEAEFEAPAVEGRVFLELDPAKGTVTGTLNGVDLRRMAWRPYRVEIPLLRPGTNRIELTVANTLANLLEEQPEESGLMWARVVRGV